MISTTTTFGFSGGFFVIIFRVLFNLQNSIRNKNIGKVVSYQNSEQIITFGFD